MFDKRLIGKQWKWTDNDTHVDHHDQGSTESPPPAPEEIPAPRAAASPPSRSRAGNPRWGDTKDSDNDDYEAVPYQTAAPSNRYVGEVSAFYPGRKYGFIKSEQVTTEFGIDCFVSASEIGAFDVGSHISFIVTLNKQGKPQARDVQDASTTRVTYPVTPCWYFANKGRCKHGDDCTFTHENKVSQPPTATRKSTNADAFGKGAGNKPARVWVPK